ncbi:class I SAM-dependent methyltransferase [Moraxella oculi]|uniref:Class I SAM-dependent methyltransferase n=1 Tax=Moraxella oculi TaxID=2940516 RepID=A0ABW8U342_9GAMM
MQIWVFGRESDEAIFDELMFINEQKHLGLSLSFLPLPKLSDKVILAGMKERANHNAIAIVKNMPALLKADGSGIVKSHLNWSSLTRRIVSAGRKSELILQACKPNAGMAVLDGTAGFGHDALILASSGATVTLIEKNPIMALLLFYEHGMMSKNANWQKLLARTSIRHGDFLNPSFLALLPSVDLIYLDPMFPSESYSSKVNKNMQLLHELAQKPSLDDERNFLTMAKNKLNQGAKLVVKRPSMAPYLANHSPNQSVSNDAIRFDKYELNDWLD